MVIRRVYRNCGRDFHRFSAPLQRIMHLSRVYVCTRARAHNPLRNSGGREGRAEKLNEYKFLDGCASGDTERRRYASRHTEPTDSRSLASACRDISSNKESRHSFEPSRNTLDRSNNRAPRCHERTRRSIENSIPSHTSASSR